MRKLLTVALLLPMVAIASPPRDGFNELFLATCMKHFRSEDALPITMMGLGAREAPPEKSRYFLGGKSGKAWYVMQRSALYVVALRDDATCAVYARRANPDQVRAGFSSLVQKAPAPLVATLKEAGHLSPNKADMRTMTYSWSRPGDSIEILFILTTSDSSAASVQAMASLSLVGKSGS